MDRKNTKLKSYPKDDVFVLQVKTLMNDDKFYTTYVIATKHDDKYEELFSGIKILPKEENTVFDRLGLVKEYPLRYVLKKEKMLDEGQVIDTSTLFKLFIRINIEDKCGMLNF